jgi:riboflavin synthase
MFTGIVRGIGQVASLTRRAGAARLTVRAPFSLLAVRRGDSVAVDGACLTVTAKGPRRFTADVIPETLSRTTLGGLRAGDRVNLETSLGLGDPVGGHMVLGHVDATARVLGVVRRGRDWRLKVELPAAVRRYVALKGSLALHGVSLTVSAVDDRSFEVALIPETLARTTLGAAVRGSILNVEADVVARYLERWISTAEANP